uniref:Uncharacterized protein n=1 Tax=Cucumis melo TaxID=3656 RepID=A0A9I9DJR7_CUCME
QIKIKTKSVQRQDFCRPWAARRWKRRTVSVRERWRNRKRGPWDEGIGEEKKKKKKK